MFVLLLVLTVLVDQIDQLLLHHRELVLVHTLTGVPVQEGALAEHGPELARDAPEKLRDGRRVGDERGRHLEPAWWHVADGRFDVVRDEVAARQPLLGECTSHLLLDQPCRKSPAKDGRRREEGALGGIAGRQQVAAAEQLVHQFANRRLTVALGGAGAQGRNAGHEEVQPPVGHHVGEQLAQVRIQLTREPKAASDAGHRRRDQVVQVVEGGPGQPQRVHADVVQRLIVQAERFIRRLHHRAEGKHGVVRLYHHLGHLRRRDDAERVVDPAREDVLQILQQQRAQPRTCAPANRVHQLKALQTVASLSHPPGALDNPVQQLGSFRVVPARPIVARTGLPGDKAIGGEEPPMTAAPEVVQGARLQVGEDGARDEVTAGSLIEVHVDTLQRQEVPVLELTARIEAVLLAQVPPEALGRPVAAMAQMKHHYLSHRFRFFFFLFFNYFFLFH
uniref:Secreted protein n=1 Tax=Anopheles atroparvus TaxID=41427 RepID=A0AAG5DAG7_ANOAO